MIFDQYSRYRACADLLCQAGFAADRTVLDIGSGPECLLGRFMPDAAMSYVDPLISGDLGSAYIAGDVFSSELDQKLFDYVTAIDVLEHIHPDQRQAFLARMSSLCKNTLILGFPTSDSSDAQNTDNAIEDTFRTIFGHSYPWLEEHYRFGLPSLADTVEQLRQMGWHCQTMGHGHAPWLRELLSFVICAWNIPDLKGVVLDISKQFNKEFYLYDFNPPHYRQFVIASKSTLKRITPPRGEKSLAEMELAFSRLKERAYQVYFDSSLRILGGRASAAEQHGALTPNCDAAKVNEEMAPQQMTLADVVKLELAEAIAARDQAQALADKLLNSRSWQLTRPFRLIARAWRYGFQKADRERIRECLRLLYLRVPLPFSIKRLLGRSYRQFLGRTYGAVRRQMYAKITFNPPLIRPAVQQNEPDYIIWGVIDWHFRIQRPQHLAQALSTMGRRVFYISAHLIDDDRPGFQVEALDQNGRVFQIRLHAKGAPVIYSSAPAINTIHHLRASIGEMLNWTNSKKLISLVQHPYWYDVATVLPDCRTVYDCMDHHEGFGNTATEILSLERALLHSADLTIASSDWLFRIIADHTKRRALIRNAAEFEHFAVEPAVPYRDPQGRRIIGYYGAIAEWFDQDLLAAVAERFSDCCVLLIGEDTFGARAKLKRFHNVKFVGEVAYNNLPVYLWSFNVCLLPFKVIPLTLATNPVKVYEYLSAGKPVVSVDLPEMKQFGDLIRVAADKTDFLSAIADVLNRPEDELDAARRQEFARRQTWMHRVKALVCHAEATDIDPMVSIIVVTYNNLQLTRECLASLEAHSNYDSLEVIVVDNASIDGTREFLAQWVQDAPNRRLILNEDNRGFAAANNQGLATATGEYLVLLNNDTYVTPGWLRTLIKHLQRDPTIGLIGPVTNNIGNEAKIDIHYQSMSEMLNMAQVYTRRHIGKIFTLRTAAFFCVMMSRRVYTQVGPLDEIFGRGFFEDDDYCRRIEQLGLRIMCAEDVFIHHQLSASFDKVKASERQALFEKNKALYENKWGKWLPHSYDKDKRAEETAFSSHDNYTRTDL